MKKFYRKRMYNFSLFFGDLYYLLVNGFSIIETLRSKRIPRATVEKIMLATTAVNDCAHCSRLHSTLALINGVEQSEIDEILAMDIQRNVDGDEIAALAFAQHYAEHDRKPEPEALQALINAYGEKKANDVIHYIRFIYIGNLTGNTFDGFVSRFKGMKPENGNIAFELFTILMCLTIFVPIVLPGAIWIGIQKMRFNRDKGKCRDVS